MQDHSAYWLRLTQYLKALGKVGGLFTLLGFLPFITDLFKSYIGWELDFAPFFYGLWLILAFGIANFRIFQVQAKQGIDFTEKEYKFFVDNLTLNQQGHINLPFSIRLQITGSLISSEQVGTHVKITVLAVDSDWKLYKEPNDIEVHVDRRPTRSRITESQNPFILEPGEINDHITIRATIPFTNPGDDREFENLGSLSKLGVRIGFVRANNKTITHDYFCDVQEIRKQIETKLVERAVHLPDGKGAQEVVEILRKYWLVDEKALKKQ